MRLSDAQKKVVSAMEGGSPVQVEIVQGEGRIYRVDEFRVNARTVKSLIDKEIIKPNGDGLFGDTQTYGLAG